MSTRYLPISLLAAVLVMAACSESTPTGDDSVEPPAGPPPFAELQALASGLAGPVDLLVNSDTVLVDANGATVLADSLEVGSAYAATILAMPEDQLCVLGGGEGTVVDTSTIVLPLECVDGYISTTVTTSLPVGAPPKSELTVVSPSAGSQPLASVETAGLRGSGSTELIFVTDGTDEPLLMAVTGTSDTIDLSPMSTALALLVSSDFLTSAFEADPQGALELLTPLPETGALADAISATPSWALFEDGQFTAAYEAAVMAALSALYPPAAAVVEYDRDAKSGLEIDVRGQDGYPAEPTTTVSIVNTRDRWVYGVLVQGPEFIVDPESVTSVPGEVLVDTRFWVKPKGDEPSSEAIVQLPTADIDQERGLYLHAFGDGGRRGPVSSESPFGLKGFVVSDSYYNEGHFYTTAIMAQAIDAVFLTQLSSVMGVPKSCLRGLVVDGQDPVAPLQTLSESLAQLQDIASAVAGGDEVAFRNAVRGRVASRILETSMDCAIDAFENDVDGAVSAARKAAFDLVVKSFLRLSARQLGVIGSIQTALDLSEVADFVAFDGYADTEIEEFFEITNGSKGTLVEVTAPGAFPASRVESAGWDQPTYECPAGYQCDRFVFDRFDPEALDIDYQFFCNNTPFSTGEPTEACRQGTIDFEGDNPVSTELGDPFRRVTFDRSYVWQQGQNVQYFRGEFRATDVDQADTTVAFQLELVEAMPEITLLLEGQEFDPANDVLLPFSPDGSEVERTLTVWNTGLGTLRLKVDTTGGTADEVIRLEAPGTSGVPFVDGEDLASGELTTIAIRYQGSAGAGPINRVTIGDEIDNRYDLDFSIRIGVPADSTAEYTASVVGEWEEWYPDTPDEFRVLRVYEGGQADFVLADAWDGRFCPGRGGRQDPGTNDCLYGAEWVVTRDTTSYRYFMGISGFYGGGTLRVGPLTVPPTEVGGFYPQFGGSADEPIVYFRPR